MLSMIVAMSRQGVIGRDGALPWTLPADLQRFRRLTWGHHLIMGRKTYDSIGRLLPGRTTVVLTRRRDLAIPGARIAHSPEDVLHLVQQDPEPFVVGGAEIYAVMLPWVGRLYLTRVAADVPGDAVFPGMEWNEWELVRAESRPADERNEYGLTFEEYSRRP